MRGAGWRIGRELRAGLAIGWEWARALGGLLGGDGRRREEVEIGWYKMGRRARAARQVEAVVAVQVVCGAADVEVVR